jgi:hypothetical protein
VYGEREHYYIIEHPTIGTLRDLEETNAGKIGHFSVEGGRANPESAMRFYSVGAAASARARITPPSRRVSCAIRSSQWERDNLRNAWPVVG